MNDGKENYVATQVRPSVTKRPIIYPKVPSNVKGPVAPLFQEWATIVEGYESSPTSLRAAWLYLGHHPAFWSLREAPEGCRVATGEAWYQSIETGFEEDDYVWIEISPSYWPEDPTAEEFQVAFPDRPSHNIEVLEHNYDEALAVAAATVHDRYGNDRQFLKLFSDRWY